MLNLIWDWIAQNGKWVAAGVVSVVLGVVVWRNKKIRSGLVVAGKYIWSDMEFDSLLTVLKSISILLWRLARAFPLLLLKLLRKASSAVNKSVEDHFNEKEARSESIENILGSVVSSQNSVLGGSTAKRVKMTAAILLEIVSGITTAIGLTIVASDISPLIAIIWGFVIQTLAGVLSFQKGKRNALILCVVLVVSMGSDYVCYGNAAIPYDAYLQKQYQDFKKSYDFAWEKAVSLVQPYESIEENIDAALANNIEGKLKLLSDIYNLKSMKEKQDQIEAKQREINEVPRVKESSQTSDDFTDNEGVGHSQNTESSSEKEDTAATKPLRDEKKALEAERDLVNEMIAEIASVKTLYQNLFTDYKIAGEVTIKATTTRLFFEQDNSEDSTQFDEFSGRLADIQNSVNVLLEKANKDKCDVIILSEMKRYNADYNAIVELKAKEFSSVGKSESISIFEQIFRFFSEAIDSEFAGNATNMRKSVTLSTKNQFEKFTDVVTKAGLLSDKDLFDSIYGKSKVDEGEIVSLETAYKNTHYRDALSVAIANLISPPEGKRIETITPIFWALLADGLVLLMGWSTKRKKTSIQRIKNRRYLNNDESRLIREALYNMSAKPLEGAGAANADYTFTPEVLLGNINGFMAQFEIEPYFRDKNLSMSFSLVCKEASKIKTLNTTYKELVLLLQTLKYIKPVSKEQYEYFVRYKRNKAAYDEHKKLENLAGECEEYYYLMTEGASLLFGSEKINDILNHIENDKKLKAKVKRKLQYMGIMGKK